MRFIGYKLKVRVNWEADRRDTKRGETKDKKKEEKKRKLGGGGRIYKGIYMRLFSRKASHTMCKFFVCLPHWFSDSKVLGCLKFAA